MKLYHFQVNEKQESRKAAGRFFYPLIGAYTLWSLGEIAYKKAMFAPSAYFLQMICADEYTAGYDMTGHNWLGGFTGVIYFMAFALVCSNRVSKCMVDRVEKD